MKNHVILDFETLGQEVATCPALDCSYFVFDWDRFTSNNPYTFEEIINQAYKKKLDVSEQVKDYGFKIETSTLEWWKSQKKETRDKILPKSIDISVAQFMKEFLWDIQLAGKISFWWTRSNTFDPLILQRLAKVSGNLEKMNNVLKYWTVRDTRTFTDALTNFSLKKNAFIPMEDEAKWNEMFQEHDSTHDIAADILRMQALVRIGANLDN